MLGAGILSGLLGARRAPDREARLGLWLPAIPLAPLVPAATAAAGPGLATIFWVFLKTGSVLFGSGYVLVAFLRNDLVARLGWISEAQLLDAVTVGQITPGPVFTTVTFIGYLLAGTGGALVATVGIFLPAFVLVAVSGPLVPRLRSSPTAGRFLDGVNVASLALMAVVTAKLARVAVVDAFTATVAVAALVLLVRGWLGSTTIVLGAAVVGVIAQRAGLAN